MATNRTYPFPRRWSEMSLDTRLFFAFHFCIILMFAAGGALSVPLEIAIAASLATIVAVVSVAHRLRKGWRWRGAGLKQVLLAAGGLALAGLMFTVVAQFAAINDPRFLPWFIALAGISIFNALISLRLVRPFEADFVADVHADATTDQPQTASPDIVVSSRGTSNRLRNAFAGALTAYGIVSFLVLVWLYIQWVQSAPTQPTQALVYQHNANGSYVYFSAFQVTTCVMMFLTSGPLALAGMLIAPKKNVQNSGGWFAAH